MWQLWLIGWQWKIILLHFYFFLIVIYHEPNNQGGMMTQHKCTLSLLLSESIDNHNDVTNLSIFKFIVLLPLFRHMQRERKVTSDYNSTALSRKRTSIFWRSMSENISGCFGLVHDQTWLQMPTRWNPDVSNLSTAQSFSNNLQTRKNFLDLLIIIRKY